jgi:hypothetical protein
MDAGAAWTKVCSSLDVIGDTEQALALYLTHPSSSNYARAYLLVYGTLQALYLQQDAVEALCAGLGLPFSRSEACKQVRDIRNDAAGHPTNRDRGRAFVFIVRHSLDERRFTYHRNGADGSFSSHDVDLQQLVHRQREDTKNHLERIASALEEELRAHMAKHSATKLADLLPDTWRYLMEKVFQEIEFPGYLGVGLLHVRYLQRYVADIRALLKARGEPEDWFGFAELEHALERLRAYFTGEGLMGLETRDYLIFAHFVSAQLTELEKHLENIDEEYVDGSQLT